MDTASHGPKGAIFYLKRITGLILLLALSATFFYSAYTKSGVGLEGIYLVNSPNATNAFDSFRGHSLIWDSAASSFTGVIARVLIGFELLLGLFLLFHIFLKSFTYKAVIAVLTIFIIYLLIVILKQGNTGNCGCFGNSVAMKPLTAIWKNVIMIAVTMLLMLHLPCKAV